MNADDTVQELRVQAFGVSFAVRFNIPEMRAGIERFALPPGWEAVEPSTEVDRLFSIWFLQDGGERPYRVIEHQRRRRYSVRNQDEALALLEDLIEQFQAYRSPNRLFVHAGAVGWNGRAIVLPGDSFAGKSTLVAALLKKGAGYLSDEMAVLDSEGLVHPFPRQLSIREEGALLGRRCRVEEFGGVTEHHPLPIGIVAFLQYERGNTWQVSELSPGEGAMEFLRHAGRPSFKAALCLHAASSAVSHAQILSGVRGDADQAADRLIELVESRATSLFRKAV